MDLAILGLDLAFIIVIAGISVLFAALDRRVLFVDIGQIIATAAVTDGPTEIDIEIMTEIEIAAEITRVKETAAEITTVIETATEIEIETDAAAKTGPTARIGARHAKALRAVSARIDCAL